MWLNISRAPRGTVAPVGGAAAVIPFSASEVINPGRGQFQGHADKPLQAGWSVVRDCGDRFNWKDIQPSSSGSYTWTALDNAIAAAAAQGRRYHMRIMAFNSFQHLYDSSTTAQSVPSWLRSTSGATTDRLHSGITYVIPNWDNNSYLTAVENLIAAIGARYDNDERVEWFEFSGYGDWSENHVAFMKDELGLPGPAPEDSIAQLGYYSQYYDQYMTQTGITRLVNAHLAAFTKTRIVANSHPEIHRQLFAASTTKPAGVRGDAMGAYTPLEDWCTNEWSWYVENNQQIVADMLDRWQVAPVVSEFANWYPTNAADFHEKALADVVNYHVSLVSNNIEVAPAGTDLARLVRTYKYAGYRYSAQAGAPSGGNVPVTWTNYGVAPTYDAWQVVYDFRDEDGEIVKTVNSSLDLGELAAAQAYSDLNADPTPATTVDSISLSGLDAGTYSVWARVIWAEHKASGTHTWSEDPMALAMTDRGDDGGYKIGGFTL